MTNKYKKCYFTAGQYGALMFLDETTANPICFKAGSLESNKNITREQILEESKGDGNFSLVPPIHLTDDIDPIIFAKAVKLRLTKLMDAALQDLDKTLCLNNGDLLSLERDFKSSITCQVYSSSDEYEAASSSYFTMYKDGELICLETNDGDVIRLAYTPDNRLEELVMHAVLGMQTSGEYPELTGELITLKPGVGEFVTCRAELVCNTNIFDFTIAEDEVVIAYVRTADNYANPLLVRGVGSITKETWMKTTDNAEKINVIDDLFAAAIANRILEVINVEGIVCELNFSYVSIVIYLSDEDLIIAANEEIIISYPILLLNDEVVTTITDLLLPAFREPMSRYTQSLIQDLDRVFTTRK